MLLFQTASLVKAVEVVLMQLTVGNGFCRFQQVEDTMLKPLSSRRQRF